MPITGLAAAGMKVRRLKSFLPPSTPNMKASDARAPMIPSPA